MMVLVFFSAHDLLGFLPLVHGPCGVFRADAMNRFLLGRVHTLCNTPPAQQSLVVGNLKISEDRMLCVAPGAHRVHQEFGGAI